MADLPADADSRSARTVRKPRVDWPLLAALALGFICCVAFWAWVARNVLRL